MRLLPGLLCLFLITAPGPAVAGIALDATNARAITGTEIILADGRTLHLEGIEQPLAEQEALRDQAQKTLQDLIAGHQLVFDEVAADRYGRLSGQIYSSDQKGNRLWLQGEMLKRGLAFVYPPSTIQLDDMVMMEAVAHKAKAGMWADGDTPADDAYAKEGRYAFVKGTVLDAAHVKNMVYLNFGADWHEDFTIAIAAHDLHVFRKAKIDPLDYKGKTVRVRGWIKRNFGPMIMVSDPAQIEILPAP